MLLKVVIIDPRETYRTRLVEAFIEDYADRIEVQAFSSVEAFDQDKSTLPLDAMLVAEELADETLSGRRGASLVYLVADTSIESMYGKPAICRYQKVELIYKAILAACSSRFDYVTARTASLEGTNVLAFFPTSGGVGASTMAAACAVAAAKRGLRTFYLNFELYGESETYFQASGSGGLDDVLFALEAKKSGAAMRIQSVVRRSPENVCFLASCASSVDLQDLKPGHFERLVREIASSDHYDVIVLDLDYAHSPFAGEAMALSTKAIFVSNGTRVANRKFERLYEALQSQSRFGNGSGVGNVVLAYNSFSSKSGERIAGDVVPVIGGLGRVIAGNTRQLVDALSSNALFSGLFAELGV